MLVTVWVTPFTSCCFKRNNGCRWMEVRFHTVGRGGWRFPHFSHFQIRAYNVSEKICTKPLLQVMFLGPIFIKTCNTSYTGIIFSRFGPSLAILIVQPCLLWQDTQTFPQYIRYNIYIWCTYCLTTNIMPTCIVCANILDIIYIYGVRTA